jgi:hypothetical protein
VFFNLGSAEPKGSAKIFLGSAKYLNSSSFAIDIVDILKRSANRRQFNKFELGYVAYVILYYLGVDRLGTIYYLTKKS